MNKHIESAKTAREGIKLNIVDPKQWIELIKYCHSMTSTSTKSDLTEMEYSQIGQSILKFYPFWFIGEIKCAFEYNAVAECPVKIQTRFTTQYAFEIIRKWDKEIRSKVLKQISANKIENKRIESHIKSMYTPQYMVNKCIEIGKYKWKGDYNYYGSVGINEMYEYLENKGEIRLSNEQKHEIQSNVLKKRKEALKMAKWGFGKNISQMEVGTNDKLIARRYVLRAYFDWKTGETQTMIL